MGLISKIEDKLTGHDKQAHSDETNALDNKDYSTTTGPGLGLGSGTAAGTGAGAGAGTGIGSGSYGTASGSGGIANKAETLVEGETRDHRTGGGNSTGLTSGNDGGLNDRASDIRNPVSSHEHSSHHSTGGVHVPGTGSTGAGVGTLGAGGTASALSGRGGDFVDRDGYGSSNTGTTGAFGSSDNSRSGDVPGSRSNTQTQQPFDQYSSSGQRAAAAAGESGRYDHSTSGHHGHGGSDTYGSRSHGDDISRNQNRGLTGQNEPKDFNTGPHSHLENRSAIPTAGGEKLGSGSGEGLSGMSGGLTGPATNRDRDTSSYERGGTNLKDRVHEAIGSHNNGSGHHTGTAGATQPLHRQHDDSVLHSNRGQTGSTFDNGNQYGSNTSSGTLGSNTFGSGDQYGSSTNDRDGSSFGKTAGTSTLGTGAGALGATGAGHHGHGHGHGHSQHQHNDTYGGSTGVNEYSSSGINDGSRTDTHTGTTHQVIDGTSESGTEAFSSGRKLGGSYEKGYEDALSHVNADRSRGGY
ncbi:hypothetical protein K431DRAFT_287460 [Polychaeton citri CBS 116435]|uniref:Uncharacterized protein n=1 Tax=Polychaeton citri CBS 116435 TaxID=1314669 RepID=A0A9P4UMD2_9PEZI|nr:hypothetical protein K431DRAFT_287460 [Polychaeton citri CBS 116435]